MWLSDHSPKLGNLFHLLGLLSQTFLYLQTSTHKVRIVRPRTVIVPRSKENEETTRQGSGTESRSVNGISPYTGDIEIVYVDEVHSSSSFTLSRLLERIFTMGYWTRIHRTLSISETSVEQLTLSTDMVTSRSFRTRSTIEQRRCLNRKLLPLLVWRVEIQPFFFFTLIYESFKRRMSFKGFSPQNV